MSGKTRNSIKILAPLAAIAALLAAPCCRAGLATAPTDIYNTESLCYEIAAELSAHNAEYINQVLDAERFAERSSSPNSTTHQIITTLATPAARRLGAMLQTHPVHVSVFQAHPTGDQCVLADSLHKTTDTQTGVFGAELILLQTDTGPHVVDMHLASEPYTQAETDSTLLGAITAGASEPGVASAGDTPLGKLSQALRSNDGSAIKASFENLPVSLKSQPFYLSVLATRLNEIDDPARAEYNAKLASAANGDSRYDFQLLIYYLEKKDWTSLDRALTRLRQFMGNDVDASILALQTISTHADDRTFYRYALQALESNPSSLPVYWLLLEHMAKQKDYDDGLLVADVMRQQFRLNLSYLRPSPGSKDADTPIGSFASSPAFAGWLKSHPDYTPATSTTTTSSSPASTPAVTP